MEQSPDNKKANSSSASQEILHFMEPRPEPEEFSLHPPILFKVHINKCRKKDFFLGGGGGKKLQLQGGGGGAMGV